MKTLLKILLITLQLILIISPVYGFNIKDRNEHLWDLRGDDGNIYINRFSIYKNLKPFDIEVSGFGEIQWNFNTTKEEKITAGAQVEKYFFKYIYLGESLQFIAGEMLDYMNYRSENQSIETTTKLGFLFPISKKIFFRIWDEYSYNLEKGTAGLNELLIETYYKVNKNLEIGIGWRHTDRIHNFDTDYCSTSFTLKF